jgi:hypothetical protein
MRSPSLGLLRLSFALVPDSSLMLLPPSLLSLSLSLSLYTLRAAMGTTLRSSSPPP